MTPSRSSGLLDDPGVAVAVLAFADRRGQGGDEVIRMVVGGETEVLAATAPEANDEADGIARLQCDGREAAHVRRRGRIRILALHDDLA